jgi:hypothetical protein
VNQRHACASHRSRDLAGELASSVAQANREDAACVARIEVGEPAIALNNTIASFAALPVTLHSN